MAEAGFNRLKGDVTRLEREIAYVNRGIKTNKDFAERVDISDDFRKKSLAKVKSEEAKLKDLKAKLKKATGDFDKFVSDRRSEDGKKDAKVIEGKYAKLKEALDLQLDPKSESAKKIKSSMEALVPDYQKALTSINKRPSSIISARSQLTKVAVPSFGTSTKTSSKTDTTGTKPTVTTPATSTTATGTPKVTTSTPATTVKTTPATTTKTTPAVTPKTTPEVTPKDTVTPSNLQTLLKKTEFWFSLPDYIFKVDPKLGELLVKAVDQGYDEARFLAEAKLTPWWQSNSGNIRERIVDREKYNELRAAGENVDRTDYGLYLSKKKNEVKAKAREIAGVTLTEEQAQSVAENIYNGFLDDDPVAINNLLIPFISKVSSIVGTGTGAQNVTAYSGQALQAYQTLQSIAKANGFGLKDILPNISTSTTGGDLEQAVLQGLAAGSIDINRVAQDARVLASQGQPQYVRNLLNQGYDLENVYAPYKNQMAAVLEISPDMINLNDPTLRSAITDKGDMNLFDFKRQLRQDDRWQYTQSARDEVSSGALKVLQDFGFMG